MAKKPGWEDFLSSFDEAQPDVVTPWGGHRRSSRKQQQINMDKFVGGSGPKVPPKPPMDPKDIAKIKVLEEQLTAAGRSDGEKDNARRMIQKIRGKY